MTDSSLGSTTAESTASDEPAISDGRYLYCLVDATTAESGAFSTTGVNDAPVHVIEVDGVGAVVHESETVYDTERPEQAKQWLLTHQQVVDTASETFGTPLPVRFDTILEGGDAGVEQWLREHHGRISEELAAFADTWEYRIHLFWDPSEFEDRVTEADDQLRDLRQRQQQAGSGKEFLLEKQFENRLRDLKRDRRAELAETLERNVEPVANGLTEQDDHTTFEDDTGSADRERVTRLAVLAEASNEGPLGKRLDEVVEREDVEIRFTGPWPPYTFAPDLGDG
jgi:hypothetical protein